MSTFNRTLANINNQPKGKMMLSVNTVVRRLYDNRENENDKVAFLERHFSHGGNCTHAALDEFLLYYSQNVDALLQVDYFSITILKRLFLARNAKSQWNFSIANIINNSKILTIDQKIRVINYEYKAGNHKVLRGISRKFFCSLNDFEFEPFKELYAKHSSKRLKEIVAARLPSSSIKEEVPPRFSDSYFDTPPEHLINADYSIRQEVSPPSDYEHDNPPLENSNQIPERSIEEDAVLTVPICGAILMAAGAIAGCIVAGPLGAVVFGAVGFVVGALIGFAICKIRQTIRNREARAAIPSETPRCSSPASMDSDSMGTPALPGSPIFRRDSINSEAEKPRDALSFFSRLKKKLFSEPELVI